MTPDITAHVRPAYPPVFHKPIVLPCPGPYGGIHPPRVDAQPRAGRVRCDDCIDTGKAPK